MLASLYQGGRPTAGAGYRARAASRRSSTPSRALVPPPRHVCERQELLASDTLTPASRHSVTAGETVTAQRLPMYATLPGCDGVTPSAQKRAHALSNCARWEPRRRVPLSP